MEQSLIYGIVLFYTIKNINWQQGRKLDGAANSRSVE